MDPNTCLYYLTLIDSKKIPIPVISKLLREFGSAKTLMELPRSKFQDLGFDNTQIELLHSGNSNAGCQRSTQVALEWAGKEWNYLVCYESQHYPSLLREIDSAPPILFVRGSLSALGGKHFAVVGSRKASIYGKRNAYWMAQELSKAGLQICSGLASGIDSKAHEGALDSGGKTIAVIGTGIDRVYPSRNKELAQRIVENGALVSEFPMGTPPYSSNFPRRNRIISGLAMGTLVVEANIKSGSLITARLTMEQNRDVFAMPGSVASPQSRGCHHLIKQGAKLVEESADILEELGVVDQGLRTTSEDTRAAKLGAKSDPVSKSVALKAVDHQGCLFQAIQGECELSIAELNAELIKLEAAGLIRQEGGRYFRLD
jgi:DNA processing protein